MSSSRNNDPFWWSFFGAGGVFSSFFIPIHVLLLGIALPLAWWTVEPETLLELARHPLARIYLFLLISLTLFHAAHRIRFTLHDILLAKKIDTPAAYLCYTGAILGSVVTLITVCTL